MDKPPSKQLNIFRAAYADIPVRDQRETMERPFFSLAKTPRRTPIEYKAGGVYVKVTPGADSGVATIWDADVLIWAATQITEALDRGGGGGPDDQIPPLQPPEGHTAAHWGRPVQEAARRHPPAAHHLGRDEHPAAERTHEAGGLPLDRDLGRGGGARR